MSDVSRRQFVRVLAATAPVLITPRGLLAQAADKRSLALVHTHTGERLSVEYFRRGEYRTEALAKVDHFLRDFRSGDVHPIDPRLLDLLHTLTDLTGTARPFQVISGYRSPATNEMLRRLSEGVAAGSLHMQGRAIDIRLEDVPLKTLRIAALSVRGGGVGFYPASDFIHIDTGRVRTW